MHGGWVCLLIALAVTVPSAYATDPGFVLPTSNALVFNVAGGGVAEPVAGRLATDVRLFPREAVYLPDGRIVIRDSEFGAPEGRLVAVQSNGRIAALPELPGVGGPGGEVLDIDVEPDGGLLAVVGDDPSLLRLGPAGWTPVPTPASVSAVAALPDGTLLAVSAGAVWRLTRDGGVITRRKLPSGEDGPGEFTQSVTPLPDGGLVANSTGSEFDSLVSLAGGPFRRLRGLAGEDVGFDDLPDGSLLAADGRVLRVAPADGQRRRQYGGAPAFGPGNGGIAEQALFAAGGVSAVGRDALLVAEHSAVRHDRPVAADAVQRSGSIETTAFELDDTLAAGAVRWIGAPPPGRLFAAIGPATYRRLSSGHVSVVTTLAAEARVVVRDGRRVVAEARGTVEAGTSELSLAKRLPEGEYGLELHLASGTQQTVQRLGVSTLRTLTLREGVAAIAESVDRESPGGDGGEGTVYEATGCVRPGSRRVVCDHVKVAYGWSGDHPRCVGTITAHLRPDGVRVVRTKDKRHGCRARALAPGPSATDSLG